MVSVDKYKLLHCAPKFQVVIFDSTGMSLGSCDTFINTSDQEASLFEQFGFLQSIKSTLVALKPTDDELYFPRVEVYHQGRDWIFDFAFSRSSENPEHIVWTIQDLTRQYQYLLIIQQERNESLIRQEIIESRSKALSLHKEIQYLNHNFLKEQERYHKLVELKSNWEKTLKKGEKNVLQLSDTLFGEIIEARKQKDSEWFAMSNLLWSVIKIFDTLSYAMRSPIYFNIRPDVSSEWFGRKWELCQLLYIFIGKAICSTSNGEVNVSVLRSAKNENAKWLCFVITDSGKADMMDPLPIGATPNDPLSIVVSPKQLKKEFLVAEEILKELGGTVSVEHLPNEGNVTTFTFPFVNER